MDTAGRARSSGGEEDGDERSGTPLQWLEAIVDQLPFAIFVRDADDLRLVLLNRAGEELLGIPRDQVLGRSGHDLLPAAPLRFLVSEDGEALAGGAPTETEEEVRSATKGPRILRTRKVPILGGDGRPHYLLGIAEDVTQRRQLELQLQQAQALEHIGRMTLGVAHDFRNFLTVITGSASMALSELPGDHPVVADLRDILHASERATALARHLLAFGRPNGLAPQVIDVRAVVTDLEQILRRLVGGDVELSIVATGTAAHVYAHPGRLEQIVMNLALNARDAMPTGGRLTIEVGVGAAPAAAVARPRHAGPGASRGEFVCLTVRDTGSGMDESTRARMFEPFFTTKAPGHGTGLGLATVYGIVMESGGHIAVDSAPGEGATFRVYLPRVHVEPDHRR